MTVWTQVDHDLKAEGKGEAEDETASQEEEVLPPPKIVVEYHAVPVLLLTDEGDLTEFDVRDKLRVCFEESESLDEKATALKVLNQEELESLVVEGEEEAATVPFAVLLERQIENDASSLEQDLQEKRDAELLAAKEEREAAAAAEGGGEESPGPAEEEKGGAKDDSESLAEEEGEVELVRRTCIYICNYPLSEDKMEKAASQALKYPVTAVLYVHSKAEDEDGEENNEGGEEGAEGGVEGTGTETEQFFLKLKEKQVTKKPNTWTLDVTLMDCTAVDSTSYQDLKSDLLQLVKCVRDVRKWQDETLFLQVPDSDERASMRYYKQLVSSVPISSCSVPVIMHCMLEQVEQNSSAATDAALLSPEKTLAMQAGDLFDAIIGEMESEPDVRSGDEVQVVFELSQTMKGSPRKKGRAAAALESTMKNASNVIMSTTKGSDVIDTSEVEEYMCKLVGIPGTENYPVEGKQASSISEEERTTRITSKEYFCEKHSLALSKLDHYEKLSKAMGCLPADVQALYGDNIMGRRYLEVLDSGSAANSILHASSVLPNMKSEYLDLEDATLLVLSGSDPKTSDDHGDAQGQAADAMKLLEEDEVELPLPVRLQDVVSTLSDEGGYDVATWPSYVYDIRVPAADILLRNSPVESHPSEDSRLCVSSSGEDGGDGSSSSSWTLYNKGNTLHYDGRGIQGTTSDGSSVFVSSSTSSSDSTTQVALEEGVVLNVNEDGTISFTYVDDSEEQLYTILHGGTLIKHELSSGEKVVMFPDGRISEYKGSETWRRVDSDGKQWEEKPISSPASAEGEAEAEAEANEENAEDADAADAPAEKEDEGGAEEEGPKDDIGAAEAVGGEASASPQLERTELPTLSMASVRDPDTGAMVLTREDLTMMIQYEEGHKLSLFSDGTRMITYASGEWETMLQLHHAASLLFKGSGDRVISIGKLSVEKSIEANGSSGSIKITTPFDSSVLQVDKTSDSIQVTLGKFAARADSGKLLLGDNVLWEKYAPPVEVEKEVDEAAAESSAEPEGEEEAGEDATEGGKKSEDSKGDVEEDSADADADQTAEGNDGGAPVAEEEVETTASGPMSAKPRVFVIYPGGEAVEFIDREVFEGIVKKAESRGDQHISETEISNRKTSALPVSHTFLSESDFGKSKGIVVAFNIAGESRAPRALQTLTVPSAITFAYVGSHTVPLPMISAIPSDTHAFPDNSKILLLRQVQEFPKVEEKELASIQEVLKDLEDFDLVNEETSPSTYMVSESQLESSMADIQQQIAATSEKIRTLRLSKAADVQKGSDKLNSSAKPSGNQVGVYKEDSLLEQTLRTRPRPGVLIEYFGSEEAEEIAAEEEVRRKNAPFDWRAGSKHYLPSQVTYGNIQKLDQQLKRIFEESYNNLSILACVLGIIKDECPESQEGEDWASMIHIAKGICDGGGQYEKEYMSFAGESVQTQLRRHLLSKIGVSLDIVEACSRALGAQRHIEFFADIESISRADAALEELFEILNFDFSFLGEIFADFKSKIPESDKALVQAAESACKTCSAASLDFSIDSSSIFKHLRSDILLAGAAGADMLDAILDALNLTKKKREFMQLFVEVDTDDDGFLSIEDFKSLVPTLNDMLISAHAIEPSEISDTWDTRISISDFLDFLFMKQTQNSPMYSEMISDEDTGFTLYEKSGVENEPTSFKDILHEYDMTRVSSNKFAPCVMNQEYLSIEGETRRTLKTGLCSVQKLKLQDGLPVKYFQMTPAYIFLGRLNPGESATGKLHLKNVGPEAARFNVGAVPAPFELNYVPGLLAAGMTRTIEVGVKIPQDESGQDSYCTDVVIKTECNILYCVVAAKVNKNIT